MKLLWVTVIATGPNDNPFRPDRPLEVSAGLAEFSKPFDLLWQLTEPVKANVSDIALIRHDDYELVLKSGIIDATKTSKRSIHSVDSELIERIADEPEVMLAGRQTPRCLARYLRQLLESGFQDEVYDVDAIELFCRSLGMPANPAQVYWRAGDRLRADIETARGCAEWLGKDV